jgi:nucleoside-diphosphate-sugar epimerase
MKILITGGSGFIGTNVVEHYLNKNWTVLSLDVSKPKVESHNTIWRNIDMIDKSKLNDLIVEFSPDYVVHLAADTGLLGKTLIDYPTNLKGLENLLSVVNAVESIKKVIFASTMLVCKAGYLPKSDTDYCPNTIYGESKKEGEIMVRSFGLKCDWTIIRPTSIWGPWFGRTYREFFEMILAKKYFNFGSKMSTKTYGYIGNVVYQIEEILKSDLANNRTLYVGDYEPTKINDWADEIAKILGTKIYRIPWVFVYFAGKFGDIMGKFKMRFPMNSFRLANMTTDNILDLSETSKIAPKVQYTRIEGTKITLDWMKNRA